MGNVQYVTDENGIPIAVQISIQDWKLIKAELETYDGETETSAILADSAFLTSVKRGRNQARKREGKLLSEVSV